MQVNYQRSRSLAAACACVLGMAAMQAVAQNAPQAQPADESKSTALEEVVVTGSFIPTLPEDAAIPVEVINYDDLQNLGKPSNMDLIKTLTETGQNIGELDRNNAYPVDAATVNLRNLGPRFTTVVFNNRRFPEQFSPAVGRFNNINNIPNSVIGNVEILKSGGAAIYGADAVAGVVNYITRKNVNGLEVSADYRYIEDSDGDYNVDGIWGKTFDGGNFIVAAAYQHRSKLERTDREWSMYSYLENPAGSSAFSTPGSYQIVGATGSTPVLHPIGPATPNTRQRSTTSGVIRDPACQALGGFSGMSATPSPVCYQNLAVFEPLVEVSDQFSLFSELNQTFGGLDFHLEGLASYREAPEVTVFTRGAPLTFPMLGTAVVGGTNNGLYDRLLLGSALIGATTTAPATAAYSTVGTNPAVNHFLRSMFLNSDNATTSYTAAQIDSITGVTGPAGRVGLLNTTWSPFGVGGHPLGQDFDHQRNTTTQYRLSTSLGGGLPLWSGSDFEWEVGLTWHYTKDTRWTQDIRTHKLQNALNGFGGPNCAGFAPMTGATSPVAAGSAGCYYLNPFSSALAGNYFSGAPNPYFVGSGSFTGYDAGRGLQNNLEMIRWLYEDINLDRTYHNYVVDPIIRGEIGVDLPGGPMQMAIGGQYRRQDEQVDISENVDRSVNPCPMMPNGQQVTLPALNPVTNQFNVPTSAYTGTQNACTGMMAFSRALTILGAQGNNYRDEKRHYPVAAGFVQVQLPILANLNADVVGRYEKFYSDVTEVDNDVFVPAIAVKWDITDWVSLRTSYGETFSQVNPPENLPPVPANGTATTGVNYTSFNYPNLEVEPETGENFSIGFVFNSGSFSATLDYNAITVSGYTRTLAAATLANRILLPGESTTNANALINCASPLLNQLVGGLNNQAYVQLVGGSCIQGARDPLTGNVSTQGSQWSNLAGTGAGASTGIGGQLNGGAINFFGGTAQVNGGDLTSNAIDVSTSYRFQTPIGLVVPSLSGTFVTKYEFTDWTLQGVLIAPGYDGLGYRNGSTGRLGQGVPEYRVNFGLLWSYDRHTVNLGARFIPSVINEDPDDVTASNARNANIGPNTSVGCPATSSLTSNVGSVPAGAGTGEFGTICTTYNTATLAGTKISSYFNLDLIYRVEISSFLDMSLNIINVLDEEPSFARTQLGYDAGYGNPLGRTIELGVTAKF